MGVGLVVVSVLVSVLRNVKKSLEAEEASVVDLENLLVNGLRNAEKSLDAGRASEVGSENLLVNALRSSLDKTLVVVPLAMRQVGVRGSVSKRSIERRLRRRDKRSVRMSIERRGGKRAVVDGSLEGCRVSSAAQVDELCLMGYGRRFMIFNASGCSMLLYNKSTMIDEDSVDVELDCIRSRKIDGIENTHFLLLYKNAVW